MYKQLNFLIDKITGYDIKNYLKEVLLFDKMTRKEIEEYQKRKFQNLKEYAAKSDIYKKFLSRDINEFPIYDKIFFIKNFEDFKTNIRKPYHQTYTSGTSGSPFMAYVSKEMQLAKRVSHQKMLKWYNLERESRELKIGGVNPPIITELYHILRNKKHLSSSDINELSAKKYIKIFNKYKPRILYGYPSALYNLLHYVELHNIELHQPDIIVTHAENLYTYIKDQLKKCFPESKIVNQYWATEANIGVTCPYGSLHVDEDTVIFELDNIDANGIGDIVITNLYSYDFPYIRYRIGDRAKLSDTLCRCGRKTKIISEIHGRTVDFIKLKDGRRIAATELYVIIRFFLNNIFMFQIIFDKASERIIVKYVVKDKNKSIEKEQIRHNFKVKMNLSVDFELVEIIEPEKSGKFVMFKTI